MNPHHRPVSTDAAYAKRHRQREAAEAAGLTLGEYRRQERARRQEESERIRYRNSLPTGLHALYALLADAPSPWHAEVIEARIETVRVHNRERNRARRRRAREANEHA